MITDKQAGWMAGVIDMKGRIKVVHVTGRKNPLLMLYVESVELDVIRELERLTGTNAQFREKAIPDEWVRRNCKEHCPEPHTHVHERSPEMKESGRWHITGVGAAIILHNLSEDIVKNDGAAQLALSIIAMTTKRGRGWHTIVETRERLRALGWKIPLELDIVVDEEEEEEEAQLGD